MDKTHKDGIYIVKNLTVDFSAVRFWLGITEQNKFLTVRVV